MNNFECVGRMVAGLRAVQAQGDRGETDVYENVNALLRGMFSDMLQDKEVTMMIDGIASSIEGNVTDE